MLARKTGIILTMALAGLFVGPASAGSQRVQLLSLGESAAAEPSSRGGGGGRESTVSEGDRVDLLRDVFLEALDDYFYGLSAGELARLEEAFERLSDAGGARPLEAEQMFSAFVGGRDFSSAAALAREWGLDPPMSVHEELKAGADSPKVINFTSADEALVEEFDVGDVQMAVVVHPGCGFSRNAMDAIVSDPELKDFFSRSAVFLIPQDLTGDLRRFERWIRKYSDLSIRVVYDAEDFAWVTSWDTPNFYLLNDGLVEDQLTGWPRNRTVDDLRGWIQSAGVTLPE